MLEGESESKALLLEIVSINSDSVIDELTFFLVEEGSFLGEVGYKDVSENSRNEGKDSHEDLPSARDGSGGNGTYEDPRPSCQSTSWSYLTRSSVMLRTREGTGTYEKP